MLPSVMKPSFSPIVDEPVPLELFAGETGVAKPFAQSVGTYSLAYASDGYAAIRVANNERLVESAGKLPDMSLLPWNREGGGWQPLPDVNAARTSIRLRCPECLGSGFVFRDKCQHCHGYCILDVEAVPLHNQWMHGPICRRFAAVQEQLGDVEVRVPSLSNVPFQFRFSGGEGLAMPLNSDWISNDKT